MNCLKMSLSYASLSHLDLRKACVTEANLPSVIRYLVGCKHLCLPGNWESWPACCLMWAPARMLTRSPELVSQPTFHGNCCSSTKITDLVLNPVYSTVQSHMCVLCFFKPRKSRPDPCNTICRRSIQYDTSTWCKSKNENHEKSCLKSRISWLNPGGLCAITKTTVR